MRKGFVLHHNGPPASCVGKSHTRCIAFWNAVKAYHQQKWPKSNDIAYSFGVCPHGVQFTGRGWDRNQFANGSDDVGVNDGKDSEWYTVLVFLGGDEAPTDAMVDGVISLIDEGRTSKRCAARVLPHNAFKRKPCPGPQFTAYARAWDNQPLRNGHVQEDDMTPEQMTDLKGYMARLVGWVTTGKENTVVSGSDPAWAFVRDAGTITLPEVLAAVAAGAADIDEGAIASAVAAAVIEALPDEVTDQVTAAEVEAAVVAGLGSVKFVPRRRRRLMRYFIDDGME